MHLQGKEVYEITAPQTILNIDLKQILRKVEEKYRMRLPRRVVAVDFARRGSLYVRFKHAAKAVGEPSKDGRIIFLYDRANELVAVELLDSREFS